MLGLYPNGAVPNGFSGSATATPVTSDLTCSYAVRAAVAVDLAAAYAVRTAVACDLEQAYRVRALVLADLNAAYAVRSQVAADLACSYSVLSGGGAPVLSPVFSDLGFAYAVRSPVTRDLTGAFAVRAGVVSDLASAYQVRERVSCDLQASYGVLASEDFTRSPAGSGYRGEYPAAPDTVVRTGPKVAAISLETARRAARVDEGDGLDDEVMLAAAGYTADAEHETQRCFIRQSWRATWRRFPPALGLSHAAPLADVVGVRFYDQSNVLRLLDPRDYLVIADAEPAYIVPAPGCAWPATADRPGVVVVEYAAGYGVSEASVPAEARLYVQAKVQQQFSPVANAKPQNFDRLLDGLRVYL